MAVNFYSCRHNGVVVYVCVVCRQLMVGEWKPPDVSNITGPPADNSIIGHVIQRLFDIARPLTVCIIIIIIITQFLTRHMSVKV